jgi:hypothetical protein
VDALEFLRIEAAFQVLHRLAQHQRLIGGVDAHVIASGVDALDIANVHPEDLAAILDVDHPFEAPGLRCIRQIIGQGFGGDFGKDFLQPLGALRALAVTLVAAILVGAPSAPPRPAAPLVAIDVSASARRAVGDETSAVNAWREQVIGAATRDASGTDDFVIVGDSLRDIGPSAVAAILPDDQASRVRAAVDRAASLGRPLVLITDGEVDDAESLAEAPAGSMVRVLAKAPRTDGAIVDLAVPASATAGDTITVAATVVAGALPTPEAQLRILLDGLAPVQLPVPALGAHTDAILGELGLTGEEIARLRVDGAI